MKAFTDIKQSKRLVGILPIESADMKYPYFGDGQYGETVQVGKPIELCGGKDVPCWTLAALIGLLPNGTVLSKSVSGRYFIEGLLYDNLLDACVDMIFTLKERNLL